MVAARRIALIEPFFAGSHRQWSLELQSHSRHSIELFTLPGENWRWRMRGGAITLAKQYLDADQPFDLLLASDMLDVTSFLSLTRKQTANIPVATYFHENQFAYPWTLRNRDRQTSRDKNYSFINFISALTSDSNFFNSQYNMSSFLEGVHELLSRHPDYQEIDTLESLTHKCSVLPLGMNFPAIKQEESASPSETPLILWNHRWDHDKNPADFFEVLLQLKKQDVPFRLAVLGESPKEVLPEFREAKSLLESHIDHWGYVNDSAEYLNWVRQADILPVTSQQEYFGRSAAEAIWLGCYPLLPNRLAYPDLIPEQLHSIHLYQNKQELTERLKTIIEQRNWKFEVPLLQKHLLRFKWENIIEEYDQRFNELLS